MTAPFVADTAAAIAAVRAEESSRPPGERLFEDPHARLFVEAFGSPETNARLFHVPFFREQVRLRTRFIDDFLRARVAGGSQVLILGAGFDCRALRLPCLRDSADVFEVDLAMQIERKRAILARAGIAWPARLRGVGCDFNGEDWEPGLADALAGAGFDRTAPALLVLEGVISYLEEPELERMFRFMAGAGAPESAAVFNFNLARLDPADLHVLASRTGFRRAESSSSEALWRRYLPGDPPPGGSAFFVGEAFT